MEFTPRDPASVTPPAAGKFKFFMNLDGNFVRMDSEGEVAVLMFAQPAVEVETTGIISHKEIWGGLIRGAVLSADNEVSRTFPATPMAPGFRGLPSNPQEVNYTLRPTDAGGSVPSSAGGWNIPASTAVPFSVDTVITLINQSDDELPLMITDDTLRQAGSTATGDVTVAARGVVRLVKIAPTEWLAEGNFTDGVTLPGDDLDTQTITSGSYSDKSGASNGYYSGFIGSISDGTSDIYGGAAITAIYAYTDFYTTTVSLIITGAQANSGWTTMTIDGTPFNRADASFSGSGPTQWYWTISGAINPFTAGEVVFT